MGGSYGGYLTMMAVTKVPDMWAAAVAIVPFVNWATEIANEDPAMREYDSGIMGDPVKNKALYDDRSPINFVDRSRRRCCCWRAAMIRAVPRKRRNRWRTPSRKTAAKCRSRFTRTKATASRAWRTRSTPISASPIS